MKSSRRFTIFFHIIFWSCAFLGTAECQTYEEQNFKTAVKRSPPVSVQTQRSFDEMTARIYEEDNRRIREIEESNARYRESLERMPFRERYEYDADFRFAVHLAMGALAVMLLMSVFASFVGLKQSVIWAFIGGFVAMNVLVFILGWQFHFGFGPYNFLFAFGAGLVCAFYAQSRG